MPCPVQVPARQRLVALAAMLRRCLRVPGRPCKVVVFMSSCDCVEFHHALLTGEGGQGPLAGDEDTGEPPLLDSPLWKLHGNLPQVCLVPQDTCVLQSLSPASVSSGGAQSPLKSQTVHTG